METITFKIVENEHNKIDSICFLANQDISFLKAYQNFAYNIDFYRGNKKVITRKIDVSAFYIDNIKMLITFSGFIENSFSNAVITSLSANNNIDELHIQLEHEITYSFSK